MIKLTTNWKTIGTISIATSLAALAFGVINFQTSEAGIGPLPTEPVLCSLDGQVAVHYDKIWFHTPIAALKSAQFGTLFSFPNTPLDVKVIDELNEVADLRAKVAGFLAAAGFVKFSGAPVLPQDIAIDDVEYAISCEFLNGPS